MSINYKALGMRVKQIRQENQLSQARLSELIDKTPVLCELYGNRKSEHESGHLRADRKCSGRADRHSSGRATARRFHKCKRGIDHAAGRNTTESERLIILHTVEITERSASSVSTPAARNSR